MQDLGSEIIATLEHIQDLTAEERRQLVVDLSRILAESRQHSATFDRLIELVLEDGSDDL